MRAKVVDAEREARVERSTGGRLLPCLRVKETERAPCARPMRWLRVVGAAPETRDAPVAPIRWPRAVGAVPEARDAPVAPFIRSSYCDGGQRCCSCLYKMYEGPPWCIIINWLEKSVRFSRNPRPRELQGASGSTHSQYDRGHSPFPPMSSSGPMQSQWEKEVNQPLLFFVF